MALTVIHERYPYRYVDVGILENGFPDYRIQKYNEDTGRYKDMYLCDNGDQLETAMEDFEYTKLMIPQMFLAIIELNRRNILRLWQQKEQQQNLQAVLLCQSMT